jgi:hypothetical protein
MAVVNNYENVVARSSSGEIRNSPTYKRTFTVRCDDPDTSMVDIANAPGIKYGDPHPHDASCFVTTVDVDADGDSMLIYTVSYSYTRPVGDLSVTGGTPTDPNAGGGGNTPPDPLQIPDGFWAGSSTLETKQSGYLPHTQSPMRMTNGRPITSGVLLDYASEQITMTNYYGDWASVQKIASSVDCMNDDTWPVGSDAAAYGYWAWKIMACNWSFKQQSSEQTRLEYYEVQVTLQRKDREPSDINIHDLQGWPAAANLSVMPGWFPRIVAAGFQERAAVPGGRKPIQVPIEYKDCDGNPLDPSTFPDNENCTQYPAFENTTEEVPLDRAGKSLDPDDIDAKAAIIVPWTEQKEPISFTSLFGDGPPYAPKKGPL